LAAAGKHREARGYLEKALQQAPEDERLARYIAWTDDWIRVAETPATVPAERLAAFAGRYGPRRLFIEDGALHYRREGRSAYRLIPLRENLFALDGMPDFRIEIACDASDRPLKIVGHYRNGGNDESPRDAE